MKLINHAGNEIRNCVILILVFYPIYRTFDWLIGDMEFFGPIQLCKLMLVEKFNYFNMSIGALGGIAAGIHIKNSIEEIDLQIFCMRFGFALSFFGILVMMASDPVSALFTASDQIEVWKWLFYTGLIFLLISLISFLLRFYEEMSRRVVWLVHIASLFGQVALPMFVLHGAVVDFKDYFDLLNIREFISFPVVLLGFFFITYTMIKYLYSLHYGSSKAFVRG